MGLIRLNLLVPEARLLAGSSTEHCNPWVLHPLPSSPPHSSQQPGRQGLTLAWARAKCHGAAVPLGPDTFRGVLRGYIGTKHSLLASFILAFP